MVKSIGNDISNIRFLSLDPLNPLCHKQLLPPSQPVRQSHSSHQRKKSHNFLYQGKGMWTQNWRQVIETQQTYWHLSRRPSLSLGIIRLWTQWISCQILQPPSKEAISSGQFFVIWFPWNLIYKSKKKWYGTQAFESQKKPFALHLCESVNVKSEDWETGRKTITEVLLQKNPASFQIKVNNKLKNIVFTVRVSSVEPLL